jgi:ubiquitin-like 1-activating enzyme E1 A
MRSSTILVLTLRSLAQETIKNLVLSGVGRLIVMDDKEVTEMDLGAGLLFREDEGSVGQKVSHFSSYLILFRWKVEHQEPYLIT